MRDGFFDFALLQQRRADVALGVGIVRGNSESGLELLHRLSHSPALDERFAEIVVVFALVRPKFECFPKIDDRFVCIAARGEKRAEIAVSHPAIGITRDRCSPKRFDVPVLTALLPGQKTEYAQNRRVNYAALRFLGKTERVQTERDT